MFCSTSFIASECSCLGSFGPQWMNKGFEVASSRKQTTTTTASDLLAFVWESERPHLYAQSPVKCCQPCACKTPWGFLHSSWSGLLLPAAVLPAASLTSYLISLFVFRLLSMGSKLNLSIRSMSKDACQFVSARWCFINFTFLLLFIYFCFYTWRKYEHQQAWLDLFFVFLFKSLFQIDRLSLLRNSAYAPTPLYTSLTFLLYVHNIPRYAVDLK